MIRMITTLNNRTTAILGLSRANTERLHAGQPIPVDFQALVLGGSPIQDLIIMAGETEQEMLDQLESIMPNQFAAARRGGRFHDWSNQQ